MLKTVVRSPHQWGVFRSHLSSVIGLLAEPPSHLRLTTEADRIRNEFVRLGQLILDPDITVTFIRAYDCLKELRRQAQELMKTDPADKFAKVLFNTFSMSLGYLLSLRCLDDFVPPSPPQATYAPRLSIPKSSPLSGVFINYSARNPLMDVMPKLEDPPAAVVEILESERAAEADIASAPSDSVHFSLAAPRAVAPGTAFVIDVWAHLAGQRGEVIERVRAAAAGREFPLREKGPAKLSRGTLVTVELKLPDFDVEDDEDTLLWEGEIAAASFPVRAPATLPLGDKPGSVFFFAEGLRIAKLHFTVGVADEKTEALSQHIEQNRYRTAFASYASENRDEVLSVIQGLEKGLPGMDIFLDVARLRSGQRWQDELWSIIPDRDIFYLFWSEEASRSPWVEKEWRCALETRGIDFISPIPLVSPDVVAPPKELGDLHFNDWVLAFKRRSC